MIRALTVLMLVLLTNAACSPRSDAEDTKRHSNTISSTLTDNVPVGGETASMLDPEEQAGMYRWSGGMQMGILWAAVKNKSGDVLRFADEPTEDGRVAWSVPSVELADEAQARQAAKSDQMNFVINEKAWIFGFESDGTTFTPMPMSGSGHSDALELLNELETSNAKLACVEFPRVDYRTCFSLVGAADVLESGDD